MTTSSSDSNRCTRISPSAVLDDRLDGKDLEWARDHLRRCEACRDRVEDFREMLLRVGRLPKAAVGAAAMDQGFAASIPDRLREASGSRSYAMTPRDERSVIPTMPEMPEPMYPEVTNIPDLMSELEREIFHGEPVQDHPTPLASIPEQILPTMEPATVDDETVEPVAAEELAAAAEPAVADDEALRWREVPVDSHREAEVAPAPPEPAPRWEPEPEPEPLRWDEPPPAASPTGHRNVIFDHQSALTFAEPEDAESAPVRKSDTSMRLAVGLGAAACVLLAAVLYEGGSFLKLNHTLGAAAPTAKTSLHPSAATSTSLRTTASAPPTATAPPATVLYTLGEGATDGSVFRIRPGTAVAGYTRLVFDIHGSGLPSMIVTRPDDSHIQVFFKNTTVSSAPVNGIRSYQVAAVEPGVQQGSEGSFLIDLARPVRVTAFTLPATAGYAWRLVVDLHTS